MDKKVQEFLDYAREDGISLQELLTGIVNIDDSYAFMTIKKEIELGKQNGADADFVYDKLLSIVSGEQLMGSYRCIGKLRLTSRCSILLYL